MIIVESIGCLALKLRNAKLSYTEIEDGESHHSHKNAGSPHWQRRRPHHQSNSNRNNPVID
jgi:hypothetical protein